MAETPLDIAVIGKANQAARHIEILSKIPGVRLSAVLYPKSAQGNDFPFTTNIKDLFKSQAIILSSPTPTHAEYLDQLSSYPGYLLIEKPAVTGENEMASLLQWPLERKKRTLINFNF